MRKIATTLAGLALLLACGDPVTYTVADLVSHLEANGETVEQTLDLADMGAPSTAGDRMYFVTLGDGTDLLVHVADDRGTAERLLAAESQSRNAAERMGVQGADTYSEGWAFGNLAVLVKDGTDPARIQELATTLER